MSRIEVVRTYVQMTSLDQLRDVAVFTDGVRVERVADCPPSFYRYLYAEVGRDWHWVDRRDWSLDRIREHLGQAGLTVWVLYCRGAPAGFCELLPYADGSTEIVYFGLLPEFTGRGLGKSFLSFCVERAWETGASRVWLHTCSLDAPAALPNYLRRGFTPFHQETYTFEVDMPANDANESTESR